MRQNKRLPRPKHARPQHPIVLKAIERLKKNKTELRESSLPMLIRIDPETSQEVVKQIQMVCASFRCAEATYRANDASGTTKNGGVVYIKF